MSAPLGKSILNYVFAFLAGIAGAGLGWIATGLAADAILGLTGMSDREGARAMYAFFAVAPFGAIAGLVLGVRLVLRYYAGIRGFARLAGYSVLVLLGIVVAAALSLWAYFLSDDLLAHNTLPPVVKFELRFPPKAVLAAKLADVKIDLDTDKNTMPAVWASELEFDGDRPVIAGEVELYFRTTQRVLVLKVPGEPDRMFSLDLAGNPKSSPEFGPWQRVDFIDDDPSQPPRKATPADNYEIRYRVQRHD